MIFPYYSTYSKEFVNVLSTGINFDVSSDYTPGGTCTFIIETYASLIMTSITPSIATTNPVLPSTSLTILPMIAFTTVEYRPIIDIIGYPSTTATYYYDNPTLTITNEAFNFDR
jgi:hypothetical protein